VLMAVATLLHPSRETASAEQHQQPSNRVNHVRGHEKVPTGGQV
jgi:hypothetical protein